MTRKKSNVKALALAVTCAILAGGYSGLNPVYANDAWQFDVGENLTAGTDGKVTGTITIDTNALAWTLNNKLSGLSISSEGITLGALANNVQAITYDGTGSSPATKISTDTIINGELIANNKLTLINGNTSAYLDVDQVGQLSQLLKNTTGNKTVIDAGDGSKVGGVEFKAGAVTGVKSINGDDQYAKFRVTEDDSNYTFRAGNLKITTGKENGVLNGEITFADTNRPNTSDEITLSEIIAASNKTKGMSRYSENDRQGTPRNVTAIENQVKIRDDGRVEINTTGANSEQSVVIDSGAGILVGHQNQVKKLLDQDSSVTDEQKKTYLNKTAGISYDGVFAGGIKFDEAKAGMSNVDGSLKAASGKFKVDVDGAITAAGNKFYVKKDGKVQIEDELTISHSSGDGTGASASLNIDTLGKLNQLVDTNPSSAPAITAGNDSTIGKVKFNQGKLSGVKNINDKVIFNDDGTLNINSKVIVGTTSSAYDEYGFYAGGHDYDDAKAAIKDDGSLKAAGGNFTVDDSGWITSKVSGNEGTLGGDKLELKNAAGTSSANLESGYVRIEKDGKVTTIDGDELKTGTMKVDKIEELTADAGVTVDGVLLKDGGVNASAMSVTGATGSLNVKDISGTSTMIYTKAADETNTIWIDPATGNISTNGTLQVGGGVDGTKPSVTIDGATGSIKVGQNDTEKFAVDGTTGNVKTEGSLEVANNATVGGNLGVTGNATVGGTLGVTGDATFGGTLNSKGNFSVGDNDEFTVDATNGNVVTKGGIQVGTADDKVLIGGGGVIATDGTNSVTLANGAVTATGAVTGSVIQDGAGAQMTGGNITAKGTLNAANGKFDVNGTTGLVTFGDDAGNQSTIAGKTATFGLNTGDQTVITGGTITANSLAVASFSSKTITADEELKVGTDVSLNKNGTLDLGTNELTDAQLGNINATIKDGQVIDAKSGSIGGVNFSATGEITDVKNITAEKGTIGEVGLEGGKITAANGGTIAGVNFAAGGNVSGINELTATTIKDGAGTIITGGNVESKTAKIGAIKIDNETIEGSSANGLSIEGVKIKDGAISDVTSIDAAKATIGGVNTLDNNGLTVATGSKVQVGVGTILTDGKVQVSDKTNITDGSLELNDTNKWTQAGGLVADKATVNGIALGTDSQGKATFSDAAGNTTTIDGDKITTGTITADELNVDKISLGKGTDKNITIGSNGDVTTKGDVTVTGADDDTSVIDGAKATFGKDAANQTIIDKGTISAKAKSTTNQIAELEFDENGLTVSGQNAAGQTSSFGFNAQTGVNTFTGQDGTTTNINGSKITSTNGTATGVLDGSNLTLTDGNKSTTMEAGKVTFKSETAGEHGGTETTIDGGTITTDTLNVERINLGGEVIDKGAAGVEDNSKLYMDAQGNFRAASGNFKVAGADGAMTNTVGNTTLKTDANGAGMSYYNGSVKSKVSVGDNNANVSAGAGSIDVTNESITSKVGTDASSTITADSIVDKVGNNSVTTDANGTTFNNGTDKTTINGGTITTGKLITDELVITGQGDAAGDGSGSLAFGGNGTIKSDVKDGSNKNTQFTTDIDGVTTKVTDGTNTTTNEVAAAGNTNTVTNGTATSKNTQTATSIGGVITNGTVKIAQTLDGENGTITNEVTDKDGKSSKLVQNGTGLEYTDSTNADNATRIDSKDVSIGSATDDSKRINLSDLGQIDDLDTELSARDEFKDNPTAVGGINAEAAARRADVARLDNRIDDVNERVDKVGAMAAAIASLKSIGYDPQAPSEFSVGLGQYKGETGVALGFFHYPNKNFMINVSLSTAGGETMGGIGATWRFGHKSPQKLLDEQREAQAKKELAAAEKYKAAAQLAKEAQERAEYAAKLARQAQVSADNAKAAADATQAKHFK